MIIRISCEATDLIRKLPPSPHYVLFEFLPFSGFAINIEFSADLESTAACLPVFLRPLSSERLSTQLRSHIMTATDFTIPVIDFAPFRSGSEAAKEGVAHEVVNAFKSVGFMYVKNHGVDDTTISKVFTEASYCPLYLDASSTGLIFACPLSERSLLCSS